MNTLAQADIFFFISSIATIIICIILSIAGYHLIQIIKDAKYISGKLREATNDLEGKMDVIKRAITPDSGIAKFAVDFLLNRFLGKKKSKSRIINED